MTIEKTPAVMAELKLLEGEDLNAFDETGESLLMQAITEGNIDRIKALLLAGADVNAANSLGMTALFVAAQGPFVGLKSNEPISNASYREIVQLLLNQGADLKARDQEGHTVLMWAVVGYRWLHLMIIQMGASWAGKDAEQFVAQAKEETYSSLPTNADIIDLLLKSGVDVNAQDLKGNTALVYAAAENPAVIDVLLEGGADINILNKQNMGILAVAIERKDSELLKKLISKGGKILNKEGETIPVPKELLNNVELLHGVFELMPSDLMFSTDTPKEVWLSYALAVASFTEGNLQNIKDFLQKGADAGIRLSTIGNLTPLMLAAESETEDSVQKMEIFLEWGVNINAVDMKDRTALMKSVSQGKEEDALFLIQKGADVNLIDKYGDTALHDAASFDRQTLVEALIAAGADKTIRNKQGKLPYDLAHKEKVKDLLK